MNFCARQGTLRETSINYFLVKWTKLSTEERIYMGTAILCFLKVGFKVGLWSGLGFTAFSIKKIVGIRKLLEISEKDLRNK